MGYKELPPIYLASSSPRRRDLLQLTGLPFTVCPSQVNEAAYDSSNPVALVETLALAKARDVARRMGRGISIGADTVVVHRGEILGKPASPAEAREYLARLAGDSHQVITGVAVVVAGEGPEQVEVEHETTLVVFRPLIPEEIAAYVATGEPLDKAGGYGIQGLGSLLVARIEGCYFNVVGLPLARLATMLARVGVNPLLTSRL